MGCGFGDAVEDFGQVLRVVVEAREIVGQIRVAVPAMFGFVSVFNFAIIGRIRGGLQKIFEQINGVVEHVIVRAAHVDVQLALKLRAEFRPIALENRAKVVMFLPVFGDL